LGFLIAAGIIISLVFSILFITKNSRYGSDFTNNYQSRLIIKNYDSMSKDERLQKMDNFTSQLQEKARFLGLNNLQITSSSESGEILVNSASENISPEALELILTRPFELILAPGTPKLKENSQSKIEHTVATVSDIDVAGTNVSIGGAGDVVSMNVRFNAQKNFNTYFDATKEPTEEQKEPQRPEIVA
jgi:preprotein translocase subunit SecF